MNISQIEYLNNTILQNTAENVPPNKPKRNKATPKSEQDAVSYWTSWSFEGAVSASTLFVMF